MTMPTMLTEQEIFTKVSTHLIRQGAKAEQTHGGRCVFRDSRGNMCAVGCLIEPILEKLEDQTGSDPDDLSTSEILNDYPNLAAEVGLSGDPETYDLLKDLQRVHDKANVQGWPICLKAMAFERNLSLPECLK